MELVNISPPMLHVILYAPPDGQSASASSSAYGRAAQRSCARRAHLRIVFLPRNSPAKLRPPSQQWALCAASAIAVSVLPQEVDAHAFLLLPKAEFTTDKKNFYAYVVDGNKVPPFSSYTTGDAERNSQGFTANYKKLAPSSLRDFILKNQIRATGSDIPSGGTAECGFSKPNITPQPLPDHIEFGNYNLQNPSGLHPGPCEAYCDDELVIPFTEDCRTRFNKGIAYDKAKCQGKSRFTFYWLATHFAPFQVYIGCAPLAGAKAGGSTGGNVAGEAKNVTTTPATSKPAPAAAPVPVTAPTTAPDAAATKAPTTGCKRKRD